LRQITVLLIMGQLIFSHGIFGQVNSPASGDNKFLIVPEGQSRSFMFTNRLGLFYYGETSLPNTSQFHGLSYLTHKFLEDYLIEIAGDDVSRSKAEVHLLGEKLIRYFKSMSVEEEVAIVDTLPILMIKIRSKQKTPLAVSPLISGSNQKEDYILEWSPSDKILQVARKHHLVRNDDANYPVWIGIYAYPEGEYITTELEGAMPKNRLVDNKSFCPGKINIYLEKEVVIFFIIGDSKNDLLKIRNQMLKNLNIDLKKPNSQIEGVRQA